ncbi:MAG: hypothetical protein AAFW89_14645 [Bacteroidota bacterium]
MNRRPRALLQSFDTARFLDDKQADRSADLAQARCEALSAVLFGNEIVIPAGAIAESPAFHDLFSEIMVPGRKAISRINDISHIPYSPFRIGLEPQYYNYDDFVKSYLETNIPGTISFVKLQELAEKSEGEEKEKWLPAFAGEAYLRKEWNKLGRLDKRYEQHSRLVDEYFGKHALTAPVHARGQDFTGRDKNSIRNSLQSFIGIAKEREIDFKDYAELEKLIEGLFSSFKNPEQRGVWYHNRKEFGEHWEFIRTWLDFDLFELMRTSYDVQLPSYFTQELYDIDLIKELVLVPTGRENHLDYFSGQSKENRSFSVLTDKIDWPMVWDRIAQKDIIDSTTRYQADLAEAFKLPATEEFLPARAALIRAATESHVLTLNTFLPFLSFEMDKKQSKLKVRVKKERDILKKVTTATSVVGGTILGAVLGMPVEGFIASNVIGATASYGLDLALKNRKAHIDLIKRNQQVVQLKKEIEGVRQYVDKEVERINYWISVD